MDAGRWAFSVDLPLFACHVDACLYECGLDMLECYRPYLIHGHFNPSTAEAAARRFQVGAVYGPGIIIIFKLGAERA